MIRIRGGLDAARIARFRKQGRGQGENSLYKPWLQTHDVTAPYDRKTKIFGQKSQRVHHLFNDIECDAVTLIDWSPRVTDIRERYPLDQSLVQRIADEIGIKLPTDGTSGQPLVIYTDLFISLEEGRHTARSVRHSSALAKSAVLNLLELERRYWAIVGHEWRIVTERDIDDTHLHNVNFGRSHIDLSRATEICDRPNAELAGELLADIISSPFVLLEEICSRLDKSWGVDGQALFLLRHLVGVRAITCPPTVKLATSLLAGDLIINPASQ